MLGAKRTVLDVQLGALQVNLGQGAALVAAAEQAVPQVSASAKEVGGEDVTDGSRAAAG